jgi:sugar phosphate isomerase/epimerase
MLKIALSTFGFYPDENALFQMSESGISAIEISRDYREHEALDLKKIKRDAEKNGIELYSYHLPFSTPKILDIASLDEEIRKNTVKQWKEYIKRAADVGINKFIAHPSSEPKGETPEIRAEEIKRAKESLYDLAELAGKNGAVIAVEDLPRSCLGNSSSEIADLISVNEKLRVCLDTNHLLGESNLDFIKRLSDKIITLHISDYDFLNERHWLPGEGKLDWQEIYNALISSGYSGAWLYEVSKTTPNTIIRPHELSFSDYYNNALEIFEGNPPTAIGTPIKNLGMWGPV